MIHGLLSRAEGDLVDYLPCLNSLLNINGEVGVGSFIWSRNEQSENKEPLCIVLITEVVYSLSQISASQQFFFLLFSTSVNNLKRKPTSHVTSTNSKNWPNFVNCCLKS